MARWKARIKLLIRHNWTFFASSYRWGAARKTCQDSVLWSGEGWSLEAKISGEWGHPWGIFFGFYKTRHILLSESANCTVLCAVVLTQYRRVTDGCTGRQTDGNSIASTVLAMRALSIAARCKNQLTSRKWFQAHMQSVCVLRTAVDKILPHVEYRAVSWW